MSDIEDFLRRAAQRRVQAKRPEIEIMELVDAEIVEAEPVDVAAHVATYLDSSDFSSRASQLGERVGLADDVMDAHLHAKFDNRLGSMGLQPLELEVVEERSGDGLTMEYLELLRSPKHLRQAIILSEILQRPRDRW